MAGVGFELRKLTQDGSYLGLLKAYGVAGLISSGPWVLSILGVMAVGFFRARAPDSGGVQQQFQISVTYLMVFSFLITSPLQLPFSRFVGDRLYEGRETEISSNLIGVLTLTFLVCAGFGGIVLLFWLDGPLLYRLEMLSGLVLMAGIWMAMAVLSAVREYMKVLFAFSVGYGISIVAAFLLRGFGLPGLLGGYVIGQSVLFFCLLALILRRFEILEPIAFGFLRLDRLYPKLALTGFLFALAIWADKFIFWFNPLTSVSVIPPLRVSEIYDLPIFLAYLCIIPGMASFVMRMETEFAEAHRKFYASLGSAACLNGLMELRDNMVSAIRRSLAEIFKIQGVAVAVFIACGEDLLRWAGISPLYQTLLNINMVAVSVQVVLMAVCNVLSYLDMQGIMVRLGLLFVSLNILLTIVSQSLGPAYYGYGFAIAIIVTSVLGLVLLSRCLDDLLYRTYMLQKASL